jgi:hypothetical protein
MLKDKPVEQIQILGDDKIKPVLHVRHTLLLEQVLQYWIADEQRLHTFELKY